MSKSIVDRRGGRKNTSRCIKEPIPTNVIVPKNCSNPCPYGKGKSFCFPCMASVMGRKNNGGKAA